MLALRISRPTLSISLLVHIFLCFFAPCSLTQDNMTIFTSNSSTDAHQNNSSMDTYQTNSSGNTYQNSSSVNTYQNSSASASSSTTYTEDGFWNPSFENSQKKNNWCGKSYQQPSRSNGIRAPPTPSLLSKPLLNLQCAPKFKPYLETDDPELGSFIVDASLTYYPVEGAIQISDNVKQLQIVFINTNSSRAIVAGIVDVNTLGNVFRFPLSSLGDPSLNPYKVLCQAYSKDRYLTESSVSLEYLPNRDGGQQAARINTESGTMSVTNQNGTLDTLIPFGFAIDYNKIVSPSQLTSFMNYLQDLKVNTVQLILGPQSTKDKSRLDKVLSDLGEAGFWVQYDMRNIYWNKDLVITHLQIAKRHPNFLLYHTAMEPDGQEIDFDALDVTSQLIEKNDDYHPISLTLSCEDYHFSNYTDGIDVVLTNPFVLGTSNARGDSNNQLPYNSIYGSASCDNCQGSFVDLVNRIRIFRNKRHLLGRDRNMQLWAVLQAVSAHSNSNQGPTGEQFLLMSTIYIIEGIVGLMTWNDQMNLSPDLKQAFQTLGESLPLIGNYLEQPQAFLPLPPVDTYPSDRFIANIWTNQMDQSILVMVANLAPEEVSWEINPPYNNFTSTTKLQTSWVYVSENCSDPHLIQTGDKISLKSKMKGYGFGAWIIQPKSSGNSSVSSLGDLNYQLFTQ